MISTLYRGSVKDVLGPVQFEGSDALLFHYTDAYSVFDWGRMPDLLPEKGAALAILAACWYERLQDPRSWERFSKSETALQIRKGMSALGAASPKRKTAEPVSINSTFNEIGEVLKQKGLLTHMLGVAPSSLVASLMDGGGVQPRLSSELFEKPDPEVFRHLVVRKVAVERPREDVFLGRSVLDYSPVRATKPPRLIPLEVLFRFSCPPGSSLVSYVQKHADYWKNLALPPEVMARGVEPGTKWDFPVIEFSTKLESEDRRIGTTEAINLCGIPARILEELFLKTVWVAGYLKDLCARSGLELADGKLEWGLTETGELMLVDAIGPDELRILKNGIQLSKEALRSHYRTTSWYQGVERAKEEAKAKGILDWKKLVAEQPQSLPKAKREWVSQLYQALANELTGKRWFAQAWSLDRVLQEYSVHMEGS